MECFMEQQQMVPLSTYSPYFSIIIPTLNEEPRIERLLKSLQRQSFKDFEIIIVDGGSKDRTAEIAQQYSARVFVKKGCKEFPSRNFGAQVSNGRILLFLSADVFLPPDTLEYLTRVFETDVAGTCGMGMPFEAPLWMKMGYFAFWRALLVWSKLSHDFHGSTNFMATRKEAFDDVGGFVDEFCADTLFFNALGKKRKVKILSRVSVFVSGRRAKKMGFLNFAAHFLWVFVYDYIPFLRNTPLTRMLANYSSSYRAKHG
jgi:glycosyltransferase involved in cell wall biosynthesis